MASYEYLSVSNGSGDAPLMTVIQDRSAGTTTLKVSSVTNLPAKFIATSGSLGPDGFITSASKREFRGRVSGSDIIIEGFETGSTDTGNTTGQVVVIRPNTNWADRVAAFVKNATGFGTGETLYASDINARSLTTTNNVSVGGSLSVNAQINATGGVKSNVAFNVYMTANVANWTQNSNNTKIPFNAKAFDLGNNFSTTNREFTAPVNGYYQFNTTLCAHNAYVAGYLGGDWQFGAASRAFAEVAMSNLSGITSISGSKLTYLTAGDTVSVNCFSSVANLTIGGESGSPSRTCYFSGHLVATP